ncbi:hypothetical protein VTL71DRAFT_12093 [Oculimacula yallundae]|uniref:Fungal lipase-type domain-containing protein n=1 Tax=Oculimacula yallundae TaxID=86028 RepID=A0ABR4CS10_9HELO
MHDDAQDPSHIQPHITASLPLSTYNNNTPYRLCEKPTTMLYQRIINLLLLLPLISLTSAFPSTILAPSLSTSETNPGTNTNPNISIQLFASLEELSRIVDISYCVGTTGISKPFLCASRCDEFPDFELVDTFNTGPLMSDSCGYIVLDHGNTGSAKEQRKAGQGKEEGKGQRGGIRREKEGRIIVAFRGTYSIANTIVDLSTVPQEYVPYPEKPDNSTTGHQDPRLGRERHRHRTSWRDWMPRWRNQGVEEGDVKSSEGRKGEREVKCSNCTVHTGFWTSWQNTRPLILPHIKALHAQYPEYKIHLVGHSLGGAVAALAGLEMQGLGFDPVITTFGEPRVGNAGLRDYIDGVFGLDEEKRGLESGRYRRVTHVDDPVPLLPLQEWGYRAHAGEHYISKPALQPTVSDVRLCVGDEDTECLAGAEVEEKWFGLNRESFANIARIYDEKMRSGNPEAEIEVLAVQDIEERGVEGAVGIEKRWNFPIPARYKMWQLFFAHRDYFWRLGLCVPGGDPMDWGRDKYRFGNGDGDDEEGKVEGMDGGEGREEL